jgi:hypothetical protein
MRGQQAGSGEIQPFGSLAGAGRDCRNGLRRIPCGQPGEYLAGPLDPGGLLGDVRVNLGGELRRAGLQVYEPVERLGLLVEQAARLGAPGADLGQL